MDGQNPTNPAQANGTNPSTAPAQQQEIITDVDKSAWKYFLKHDIPFVVIILLAAGIAMWLYPVEIFYIGFAAIFLICILFGSVTKKVRRVFMQEFGDSIGYAFSPSAPLSSVDGKIFKVGSSRKIFDILTGEYNGLPVRVFCYQYSVQEGKNRVTFSFTFFEVTFSNNMPDIVVLSALNGLPGLSVFLSLGEHIRLEGDFNSYFSLYVPKDFETEAYQIFTPDIMADLIDRAKQMSFEFNGNKLYIYERGLIDTTEDMNSAFGLADYLINLFKKSSAGVNVITRTSLEQAP